MKPNLHRMRDLLDDESDAGGLRLERVETMQPAASGQGEAAWPALLFTHPVPPQAVLPSLAPVAEPLAGAAPVASNSSAVGFRNTALNGFLKASDAESDALSYTLLTQPAQGSVVHNGSGSFTYTPPNGFSGTTSFTFRANDGTTNSNTATVTVTVSNNTAPAITVADIDAETYSNDLRADALLDFKPDWNLFALLPEIDLQTQATLRAPTPRLSYTFDTAYSAGSASEDHREGPVTAFNAAQQAAATAILAYVTTITGIPFELTHNATSADIHFAAANVDFQPGDADDTIAGICLNSWGWSTLGGNVTSFNAESIVLLDNLQFAADNAAPVAGNDGYQILLHEIGHALGLGHPFENADPSKRLAPGNDNTDNTVMSYTWTGATKSIFQSYDLLALRWIYGEDGLAGTWGFNSFYGPSLTLVAPNSAPTSSSTSANATEDQTLNGQLPAATDVDGQAITYSRVNNASHGSVTVNANGSYSYVPAANYNGSDSFDFRVTDTLGAFNTYSVTINVAAVNDAPVLANAITDQNATAGAAFAFVFASNTFSDVDGQALTYTAQLQGGGALPAWLSFNAAARSFSGTPQVANVGTLNVQVNASDGGLTASDVFTITVAAAPNQAPVASNTTVAATEDLTLAGNLPVATDGNGDPITYARTTNASHGTALVGANGSFSYTPAADFNGSDSFGFSVSDNRGGSNSYTVTVNVAAVNDAPVLAIAIPDQKATAGTAFAFTVAANAFTDIDSNTLTYSAALQSGAALPAWLAFTPATRSFSGTATNGDAGTLAIRVTASDGSLTANDVFSLVVAQLNLPPLAANVSVNATEDQSLAGQLPVASDPNGDAVVYARATQAAHGTATVNANGSFGYTPAADYFGNDSFSYRVSDALGAFNSYTVSLSVAPVNDAPVAQDAGATTAEDQALEGSAQADDIDSQQLEYTLLTGPVHGTLQLQLGGSWRYVPAADFNGSDSFVFRASDGALNSTPATVSLTITPVNDAPTATGASVSTPEDTALTGTLQASDIDSSVLSVIVITQPAHGSLELLDGLSYRYRPAPEFSGSDSFGFIVRDGALETAIVTQSITVTPVNDAPRVPVDLNAHAIEDQTATGVLTADDPDRPTITFELVSAPAHGVLELLPGGQWSYTPDRNFAAADQFTYRASDGLASSGLGQVSFAVQNINDIPSGGLVIVGEALVGQAMSVLSSVSDVDGLAAFGYRWLRVAANGQSEPVATTASYTPVAADIGQRLRVEVSFIDGGGTAERVFSALSGLIGDAATTTGTAAGEHLTGSALPDFIDGGDGNDTLIGAAGNDTLVGGTGNDSADGGAGFDTLSYRGRSGALVATLSGGTATIASDFDLFGGIEALIGGNGNDQLDGDDHANRLDGDAGNDSMRGGAGDDTLAAGTGNDTLDGGAGSDTADYDGMSGGLLVDLPAGSARGDGKEDLLLSIEHARGGWGDDSLIGGADSQRLDGNAGDDSISAGDGNDVLIGGLGRDTLDGGAGRDVVIYRGESNVSVDLSTGIGNQQGDNDVLIGIEAVVGGSGDDFLVGSDDTIAGIAQSFRGGAGNDVIDGKGGVDQAQFSFPYAEYQVLRQGSEVSVGHIPSILNQPGGDGLDSLTNIERLLFSDRYIAFGARAEEVARVAFVLWSPAIAISTALFARGISFYDVGYDFRTLVETALLFHPDSDAELAAKLVVHTPGTTKTAAQLLALMQSNGGGAAGRIAAVSEMANDPRTADQVALAGFITHGVPCDLTYGDTVLFAQLPVG